MKSNLIVGLVVMLSFALPAQSQLLARAAQVTEANNTLGMKLLTSTIAEKPQRNILISPLSASMALAIVYNGSKGNTQAAMQTALQLQGMNFVDLNAANATLLEELQRQSDHFKVEIANSLWLRESFNLLPSFVLMARQNYDADVTALDFASTSAAPTINGWVKQKTHGKIDQIVGRTLPQALQMLVANATYFKADWASPFNARSTGPGLFNLNGGKQEPVTMMAGTKSVKYLEDSRVQAAELSYGSGEASMIIILPKQGSPAIEGELQSPQFAAWLSRLESATPMMGSLQIPKFSFKFDQNLNAQLSNLGMAVAFTPQADFSAIAQGNLQITDVVQKTFIAVDEKGTEAAVVTSIAVRASSMPQLSFRMTVDRPFYFVIRDNAAGTLLFVGKVVDPNLL